MKEVHTIHEYIRSSLLVFIHTYTRLSIFTYRTVSPLACAYFDVVVHLFLHFVK